LLLSGHLDTKPPGELERWKTDPYAPMIVDGRLYGLGACDMKGQAAALVYALAALAAAPPDEGEVLVALSADEECGSEYGARYLVADYGLRGDAAVVCEASGVAENWENVSLVAHGFSGFRVQVHGTQIHSSVTKRVPSVNASTKMAYVLSRLAEDLDVRFPPHPLCPHGVTVNAGVLVSGGVYYGVCPGYAEFAVDVRTLPGMTKDALRKDVEAFLDRLRAEDPALQVELEFDETLGWNDATEIPADAAVVDAALKAAEAVLERRIPLGSFPGGTDATIFARAGIPTIPAFGPGLLPLAHSPNEYIETKTIVEAAKIYSLLASTYLAGSDPA
jgi:acetylornithine deacetylase